MAPQLSCQHGSAQRTGSWRLDHLTREARWKFTTKKFLKSSHSVFEFVHSLLFPSKQQSSHSSALWLHYQAAKPFFYFIYTIFSSKPIKPVSQNIEHIQLLSHTLLLPLQGIPEDLLFFYQSLHQGGGLFRVDQCLLVYRYHEKAATHSVTESVSPPFPLSSTHTHILGHNVDPPPTHSCPLASHMLSTLTH